MPLNFRPWRAKKYNVSTKNSYVVCVNMLDNRLLECTLTADSTGQECLENIAQRNELVEHEYFGFRYVNKKLQFRWIELEKPLKKQLDKFAHSPLLYFGVTYYVANPDQIQDENARYQYYLQLKADVIDGKLPCTPEQAVLLAAYSLQVEFGDHDLERHAAEVLKDLVLLPRNMTTDDRTLAELTQGIVNTHHSLQGMASQTAELQYVAEARHLENYGIEYYPAKDDQGNDLLLGSSFFGIYVKYLNEQPAVYFKWSDISNLLHSKKSLGIETSLSPKMVQFQFDDADMAKYIHKVCTLQHNFYCGTKHSVNSSISGSERDSQNSGSTGPLSDLQQSAQVPLESQEMTDGVSSVGQYKKTQEATQTQPLITDKVVVIPDHTSGLIEQQQQQQQQQQTAPVSTDPNYTNGHLYSAVAADQPQVVTNTDSTQLEKLAEPNLQPEEMIQSFVESAGGTTAATAATTAATSTNNNNYMNRLAALPAYRPTPDYETVMQRKMEQLAQVQQQSQQQQQQHVLDHGHNLGQAQVYAHPELMAYSQPEIGHPPSYTQYLSHASRAMLANGSVMSSAGYIEGGIPTSDGYGYQHVITRPVDRTSSLIIYPTYRTPELSTPGFANVMSTSENRLHETAITHYRLPPPYPRPSNSTPDLASQSARSKVNDSPDLVPHTSLVAQSRFDQSVENLAQDASNLRLCQMTRSSQNLMDDNSSTGTQSDFQTKDSPLHVVGAAPVSGQVTHSQVYMTKPPPPYSATHQTPTHIPCQDPPSYAIVQDTTSQASPGLVRNPSSEYKHMILANQQSQPTSLDTQIPPANHVTRRSSGASGMMLPSQVVGLQNPGFNDLDTESDGIECLDVSRLSSDQSSNPPHSKTSSMDTSSLSQVEQPAGSRPELFTNVDSSSGRSITSSRSNRSTTASLTSQERTMDDEEELDMATKRKSMGPLKVAALNGLSLSRGSVLEVLDQTAVETSKAPKDERRKNLEGKLEEGQVFAEFEHVLKKRFKCECGVASQLDNQERNRLKDVVPYDDNRVKLTPNKQNAMGYINASHVKMKIAGEDWWYIAAQGPLPNTVNDFWQMIWEQEVEVVAMLTGLQEAGKPRCHRYWPELRGPKNRAKFKNYEVTLKFTNSSRCYMTSGLVLKHVPTKKERLVWHLQYTDWPDHGCPEDPLGFLAYLDEIESVQRHASMERNDGRRTPVVVHCSMGVGRSGVLILAEIMKACLEHNENTDVPEVLKNMREQRMHMVQTVTQYSFVYQTLIEYLNSSRLI